LGDVACSESIRIAGDDLDQAIIEYMKRTYSLLVGEQTAENIKIQIGSACPLPEELEMEVGGRDLIAGLPRTTTITSQEIREALTEPIQAMIEAVKRALERTEPELSADLVHNGITMCGGGSLLRGLPQVVAQATGLKVRVADDPVTCVARGTGIFLEHLDRWGSGGPAAAGEEDM
jgi:rod shape-determining protein MreB